MYGGVCIYIRIKPCRLNASLTMPGVDASYGGQGLQVYQNWRIHAWP